MKLQVMICTHGTRGLERVAKMNLPVIDGVGYIVSSQCDARALPVDLVRDDIDVYFTPTTGLSNNRNHAFDKVSAPYCLIADDDLILYPDGIARIAEVFEEHPDLDIATFRCEYPYPTVYPPAPTYLNKGYKNYNITSFEIALRTEALRLRGIRFSPLMGIGAPYLHAGEENMLILACLKAGMKGMFFPVTIARHPAETTGIRERRRPGVIRANGAYVALAHPFTACLRLPLIAWRTPGAWIRNLYHLTCGALFAFKHRKELLCKEKQQKRKNML